MCEEKKVRKEGKKEKKDGMDGWIDEVDDRKKSGRERENGTGWGKVKTMGSRIIFK